MTYFFSDQAVGLTQHQQVQRSGLFQLHLAAFFLSWAVVSGKLIGETMSAYQKIGIRCLIAAPLLLLFAQLTMRRPFVLKRRDLGRVLICGVLMGAHWTLFFLSAQVSTATVGQLMVFTAPVMSALIEPFVSRRRVTRQTFINAVVVAIGMALPFWGHGTEGQALGNLGLGVIFGLFSAASFAVRNLIAGDLVTRYDPVTVMSWQAVIVGICWLPAIWMYPITAGPSHWAWMVVLAVVSTAIGHTMFVVGLSRFSVATATVIVAIQPVYVSITAYLTMGEVLTPGLALGGGIVVGAVLFESRAAMKASAENQRLQTESKA